MKKKLSLLLAALLVMTLVPVSSFAVKSTKSNAFSVDYGATGADAEKTFVIEFDTELDTIATDKTIRLDLKNAEFKEVKLVPTTTYTTNAVALSVFNPANISSSIATLTANIDVKGSFALAIKVDTKDSDEGDVLLTINNDVVGMDEFKIGTVKETTTSNLSVVVDNKAKTVSMAGGSLSKFEIKNHKKTKDVVIELDGNNATLTNETKINGVALNATPAPAGVTISAGKITIPAAFLATASFIVVEPVIAQDRRMELGSVEVEVTNDGNTASAVIGEVVDYNVTVKVVENGKKEIPTRVAGKTATVKVTISGTKGSITPGRAYDLELSGATVAHNASGVIQGISGSGFTVENVKGITAEGTTDELTVSSNTSDSKIEFTMDIKVDSKAKNGVATMTVSSRDLDGDITVDIAKVETAFDVATKVTEIKRGESSEVADIVVTENKAGQLTTSDYVIIRLNGKTLFNEKPTIEGTNGLKFGDVEWIKVGGDTVGVQAKVTSKSKGEPGKITISGAAADMLSNGIQGRTYTASLFIGAKNGGTEYAEFDYTKCVAEYSKVSNKIVFTLGSANYTVNGVVNTLEAPVFTKDGRTMLPIGPLALALGLEVNYNEYTQTATFRDTITGQIVSIRENAQVLYNNGIEYQMHTAAITVNGRIFVPVASVTDAFGAKIVWDASTQTVTIN